MERPLEAEVHEGESSIEETQKVGTGLVDPPTKGNPKDENLGDVNQLGDSPFSKSPNDKAYPGEDLENDNCSGDTITLGYPEK